MQLNEINDDNLNFISRRKLYNRAYHKMYYNEHKQQNTEAYQKALEKGRERYYKKIESQTPEGQEKKVIKKYKKRNLINPL
jgi:hypothetical protein